MLCLLSQVLLGKRLREVVRARAKGDDDDDYDEEEEAAKEAEAMARATRRATKAAGAGAGATESPPVLLLSPVRFFFLPVLKSVSYQPAPLSRNAGADSSFFSSALWQAGQSVSGASLNFCMVSSV